MTPDESDAFYTQIEFEVYRWHAVPRKIIH